MEEISIVVTKLSNGEEIVGYFMGEDDTQMVLRYPMTLLYTAETGAVKLDRYLIFAEADFHIFNRSTVVSKAPVTPEFAEYYNNNVAYFNKYEEPALRSSVRKINAAFMNAMDDSANRFVEAAREFNVDLKALSKQRAN